MTRTPTTILLGAEAPRVMTVPMIAAAFADRRTALSSLWRKQMLAISLSPVFGGEGRGERANVVSSAHLVGIAHRFRFGGRCPPYGQQNGEGPGVGIPRGRPTNHTPTFNS